MKSSNLKTSEKLILLFAALTLMLVLYIFYGPGSSRKYVNVNCPKCNSTQMVETCVDNFNVQHLLCLDCHSKFTMQEIEDLRNSVQEKDFAPTDVETKDAEVDSMYNPDNECPD